ncbi:transposable element Tc1 transposase [Trichonephila clavipes]|nr:transposable element Tc1 transposase [Trichonephila clavipes]
MHRSDAVIGRCWQEWVDNGKFQCHEGSGRPRATVYRENGIIVRLAATSPDSSLSTFRSPQSGVMVWGCIYFDSWIPLVVIRGTHTAQWYFDDILRTVLLQFLLQYLGLIFQQDNARPHAARVIMNFLTARQILYWFPDHKFSLQSCMSGL